MSRLERRYRAMLRLLPRWYRAVREEEMVGTFLADRTDDLDLEYGWPGWREAWAVAVLAVRTRLAADAAPARVAALGATVRLVALLGLLVHSALGISALAGLTAVALRPPDVPPFESVVDHLTAGDLIPVFGTLTVVGAFVLLLRGRRTMAKACAAAALAVDVAVAVVYPAATASEWLARLATGWLPLWAVVACLFAGFHRDAPMPRPAGWLRAAAVALVLAVGWNWIALTGAAPATRRLAVPFMDIMTLPALALVLGGMVYLAVLRPRGHDGTGAWPLALVACAALLLPGRLNLLAFAAPLTDEFHAAVGALAAVQVIGLLAVSASLAVVGIGDYRRLPVTMSPPVVGHGGT